MVVNWTDGLRPGAPVDSWGRREPNRECLSGVAADRDGQAGGVRA